MYLDINECFDGIHVCHKYARCINTIGSYVCECADGFVGNGKRCTGRPPWLQSRSLHVGWLDGVLQILMSVNMLMAVVLKSA